jgi:hypothetical protein
MERRFDRESGFPSPYKIKIPAYFPSQNEGTTTQHVRGCIQKFPDWPPGERTANGTALCHCVQLRVNLVSSATITLCVASQPVFIVVSVYFVIDLVRKRLDTPSYCARQARTHLTL